jgi:hypothetical protein
MANDLTAFNPEIWSGDMQTIYYKESRALGVANVEMRDQLSVGDTLHRPYNSYMVDQAYSKGTDISVFNDLTTGDEYLTVDTTRVVPFYVDDIDKIQNKWLAQERYAYQAMRILNNRLDQAVLGQYSYARTYISAQDLGGSGTGSIAITQANISNMFAVGYRKLDEADAPTNNLVAFIGPRLLETLKLYVGGRETGFGETVSDNGLIAKRFGFDLIQTNNIPFTAVLTISSSVPSNGETVTIAGVVFEWETHGSNCDATGEVDLGTTSSSAADNLVLAINGTTAGTTSTYYDVSKADRKKLRKHGISASNDNGVITITGYGDVAITEASTNVALTSNTQYPVFMMRGAIDLVTQKSPSVEFRMAEKRLGRYVYPWMLYGIKTFDDAKDVMTYAKVDTSAWVG